MYFNPLAILVAAVLQFVVGAIWYTFLFGKLWGKMHGFDKLSKATQEKMMKSMGPTYAVQFLVTVLMSVVLGLFVAVLPQDWNAYGLAGFFWIGFIVPTLTSSVIFGGTDPKWVLKKIAVQAGAALVSIEVAAAVFTFFK